MGVQPQRFVAAVVAGPRGRMFIPLPFDPDAVWAPKQSHHVRGSVGPCGVRAVVEPLGDGHGIVLGPAWRRDREVAVGDTVEVVLEPEGPQRDGLAEDLAAALTANPAAGAFFDSLAQFYRRAYLRWIDATTRRPELRAERIAEVVMLLAAGIKERPKKT
jgi:Bacteriocin-protection, YdeI or OmpD-Associated/Domain of unknown function (DUF1905)